MPKGALKAVAVWMVSLVAIGLTVYSPSMMASGPSNSLPQVRAVSIHKTREGIVIIDIGVTHAVPYRTFELSGPDRLVVDLQGACKAVPERVYPIQSELLGRVRVGQWQTDPAIVRVVADLEGTPAFSVKRQASGIRIELKPRKSAAGKPENINAQTTPRDLTRQSPFTVHRFKDLTASLTAPELPPQDHLVPVTKPDPPDRSDKGSLNLASVSGILIKPDFRGETFVDITSTRSVPYRVFQLADPLRLVVDLKDAHDATARNVYPVGSPVLKRIRVAQWRPGDPPVVRVVADLEGYPIFDVHAEQPGIRIELRPRQKLGSLFRNPFEFAIPAHSSQLDRSSAQAHQAMTAAEKSTAAASGGPFSNLKVIGFVDKNGSGTQAVISDRANIYFVPNGGAFENTFRVIAISPTAVEIQNIETLDSGWLAYTP